jgi:uncharacterized OB-fold protein
VDAGSYTKLLPEPTPDTQPYWDGLKAGRLMLQSCADCGKIRHYPRPVCPYCHSMAVRWREARGTGRVHSWTVTHHAFHPGWKGELPITLVTVDLDEGVRMQAELEGTPPGGLAIGSPVKLAFSPATETLTLPIFVPA